MRIIGVTGGIGSGKSTVSRLLEEIGGKVIDADQIAKEVVCKGCKALDELVETFGTDILNESGELNRKKLAEIVFNNSEKLNVLNMITHKYVTERILNEMDCIKKDRVFELIVLDVPVPVKHGFLDSVDEVWVVAADIETRIARVMQRSGLSRMETINRIKSQMSDEDYIRIADKLIQNDGDRAKLKKEVMDAFYKNIVDSGTVKI